MLYKFKSQAGADLIMLEATGTRVLDIIGKARTAQGIIEPAQMAQAAAALQAAFAEEEKEQQGSIEIAKNKGEVPPRFEAISLRKRATPFVAMLQRCGTAKAAITWGV